MNHDLLIGLSLHDSWLVIVPLNSLCITNTEPGLFSIRLMSPCAAALTSAGNFSMHAVHSWLREVLPDVPAQLPSSSGAGSYLFKECQLGTMLSCNYTSGRATFVW